MSTKLKNPQKTARGFVTWVIFILAVLVVGLACYWLAAADAPCAQEACIAARATDLGIGRRQLSRELRYQSELVTILSSCSGMAP